MKSLEISCHGIPWLMLAIAGIYVTSLKEASVNLLIGLVLDIVIVAVLKAFTRRRRPAYDVDDQVFCTGTFPFRVVNVFHMFTDSVLPR